MLLKFLKKVNVSAGLFNGHFVDVKIFYALKFNAIPNILFIADVNSTRAFKFINETCKSDIVSIYQHCYFKHDDKEVYFNNSIFVLNCGRMVELTTDHCQVLYPAERLNWAKDLVNDLAQFRIERGIAPTFRRTQIVGFAKEAEAN